MKKYTLKIDGMMCENCERHMNEAIKNNFNVKEVNSSHKNKECVVIAEELDEEKLKSVVADTGYTLVSVESEPYAKKGLFSFLKK